MSVFLRDLSTLGLWERGKVLEQGRARGPRRIWRWDKADAMADAASTPSRVTIWIAARDVDTFLVVHASLASAC